MLLSNITITEIKRAEQRGFSDKLCADITHRLNHSFCIDGVLCRSACHFFASATTTDYKKQREICNAVHDRAIIAIAQSGAEWKMRKHQLFWHNRVYRRRGHPHTFSDLIDHLLQEVIADNSKSAQKLRKLGKIRVKVKLKPKAAALLPITAIDIERGIQRLRKQLRST